VGFQNSATDADLGFDTAWAWPGMPLAIGKQHAGRYRLHAE
jgi:hypothetical protein